MTTLNLQVVASNDDTYCADSGSEDRTANAEIITMGQHPSLSYRFMGGFRFTGTTIPQGAVINSATLTLTADRSESGVCGCDVKAEDVDDSTQFGNEDPTWSGRTPTSASVAWAAGAWTMDAEYESPDIASVIQEIVNRGGWSSGNAINILFYDDGSGSHDWRACYSYDGNSAKAAKLDIDYTAPAGGGYADIF